MSEPDEVVAALGEAGVLAGVRWAYRSAATRTLEQYSEEEGLDVPWLGTTRYTYFRDRLDRVFACERYAVSPDAGGNDPFGLLEGLSRVDIEEMPRLEPGVVVRSDLNRSPGWLHAGCRRILLASCEYGQLANLSWQRRSPTKQQVARQPSPDPPVAPTLFDHLAPDEVAGLMTALQSSHELDVDTFVVAHTLDSVTADVELVIGRPRLSDSGGDAWYWSRDILDTPPFGRRRIDDTPRPAGPHTEPDAPVRLRPTVSDDTEVEGGPSA